MKVTLIYPAVGKKEDKRYIKSWKMEPLPLMTLAALTPEGVELKFFDDRLEKIDYNHQTDLVAINIEAYSALRAYNIAKKFMKRGIPVIFGGYHATLMPDEATCFGASVLLGEAESVWPELLKDAEAKNLKKIYKSNTRPQFGFIEPRRDILMGKKYTPLMLTETSRGCTFSCNFCSIYSFFGGSANYRSPKSVVRDIKANGSKNVFFVDDNIIANPEKAKELFRALIPLKIRWISQFSINKACDNELLTLMRKSGCIGLLIGFESLNHNNLKLMGKDWNQKHGFDTPLKRLRDHGLCIYATFVFGYEEDTRESFEETLEFALKNKFFFAAFNHLQPFPGTDYYKQLEDENRLLYKKWWLDPNYKYGRITFRPKNFEPEELENLCIDARSRFYSFSSTLRRGLDFKTNSSSIFLSSVFWTQNFLAKKEVRGKWGLPLAQNLDTAFK